MTNLQKRKFDYIEKLGKLKEHTIKCGYNFTINKKTIFIDGNLFHRGYFKKFKRFVDSMVEMLNEK